MKSRSSLLSLLLAVAVVGAAMHASRLNGTSRAFAQSTERPIRTSGVSDSIDANTFRQIAEAQTQWS